MKKYTEEEVNAVHSAFRNDMYDLYLLLSQRKEEGNIEVVVLVEQIIRLKKEVFAAFLVREQ